jgi:dipeptidyl aminopeptidase/acylaminoacyl peptidase
MVINKGRLYIRTVYSNYKLAGSISRFFIRDQYTKTMKILLTIIGVVIGSVLIPQISRAADIHYGTLEEVFGDQASITYSGFTQQATYTCSLSSFACKTSDTTQLTGDLFKEQQKFINPAGTQAIAAVLGPNNQFVYSFHDIKNGKPRQRHTLPFTGTIRRVFWTTGPTIVFTSSTGFIWQYNTTTNTTTQSIAVPGGATWLQVSPNGNYLAYYLAGTRSRGMRTFGVIDIPAQKIYTTNEPVAYWDLLTEGVRIFSFSPDSTRLLYITDKQDVPTLYSVSLASLGTNPTAMAGTRVFTKNYSVSDVAWIDNETILFSANREIPLQWSLYTYNLTTEALNKITSNVSYDVAFRKHNDLILFSQIIGNTRQPMAFNIKTRTVNAFRLPQALPVQSPASTDEVVTLGGLTGVLKKPRTTNPTLASTLIVWLHGGPFRQTSIGYHPYKSYAGYDWVLEEALEAGVPVLKLDYPGSYGYGRALAESVSQNVGVVDSQRTAHALSLMRQRGYSKFILMGNSYGGYLALKTMVDTPQTPIDAISINGVTDWDLVTFALRDSIFNVQFSGVKNPSNAALYERAAIAPLIPKLTTQRTMLIHGGADRTIAPHQSNFLHSLLVANHKSSTYITYPGEDHVFAKPDTFQDLCQKILTFASVANVASNQSLCHI